MALDISDLSLKFIQLERKRRNKIILKNFGEYKLPPGLIQSGDIIKKNELTFLLKDIFKNNRKFFSNFVVCNLPEQHTFVKLIKMPKMSEKELKEAVGWQIEDVIPLKLGEVYYDAQVLNYSEKSSDHTDVLIAAAKKTLVNDYVSVLEEVGFKLKKLEPESIAISRAVIKDFKLQRLILIADWGATQITFIVYSNGAPRFTNSIQLTQSNFLTSAIAKKFNISLEDAEIMKFEIGLNKHIKLSKYILEATEPILKDFVEQIKKSINYYETYAHEHLKDYKISEIILAGGESNLYGLTNYLNSELGLRVHRANPLLKILKSPFEQLSTMPHNVALRYTTAIGLALPEVIEDK